MNNPHVNVLKQAIEQKLCVRVLYNETDRFVEPHAVGRDRNGDFVVRVFQPNGYDTSTPGWKLMKVDAIQRVTLTENPFPGAREGFKVNDKAMTGGIEAQLS